MGDNFSSDSKNLLSIKPPSSAAVDAMIGSNLDWKLSLTVTVGLLSIVAATSIKFIALIRERFEKHKIFDRGNLPSIDAKNPFTGNLLDVFLRPPNSIKILKKYHQQLGKSFGLFYGPNPWVITIDVKFLHKLIVVDGNKNVDSADLRTPFVNHKNSVLQLKGNEWRRMRRLLNPPFAHMQMKSDSVFQDVEVVCTKMLNCVLAYPLAGSDGRIIDVLHMFQKFTIEVFFKVACRRENAINMTAGAKDEFVETLNEASRLIMNPALLISIMFDGLSCAMGLLLRFTRLSRMMNQIHSKLSDCLVERRRGKTKVGVQDELNEFHLGTRRIIDALIELVENKKIDNFILESNLLMIFLASYETTANALTAMFWLLARHPNIQEKLRQAIKNEGEEAIYLDWCLKESLRLFPSVPFTGRTANEDMTTSQGQTIFKGTTIIANIYSLHHCAEYWGPDVGEFRPERFDEPLVNPLQYLPFGGGPRDCLGKNFAMAAMRAILARIILKFKVETCGSTPDEIVWSAPNFVHTIMEGPINLRFLELTCL